MTLCDFIYRSRYLTEYRNALNAADGRHKWSRKIGIFLCVITVFVCSMAVFSTLYFSDRTKYMLDVYGVAVTDAIRHDILHLQVQFLFSVLALCLILILVILMVYRYMKHREYVGEMDALTGVMGRRLFLNYCAECQAKAERGNTAGWFLFLDVDRFKQINDTLGHSAGDEALKQIASVLRHTFGAYGAVGRVGGDEFAAILEQDLSRAAMEQILGSFLTEVAAIPSERTLSCSIGAYHFRFPKDVTELLTQTDHVLYQAKENGRACFAILEEL